MPKLLTTGAIVTCPHGGIGTSTPATPICTISGQVALAELDTGVLACPFLLYPCVGYTLRSMGLNATTILGRKAILETDFQQSVTGLPLTIVETQVVFDDRTAPGGGGSGGGATGGATSGATSGAAGGGLTPELLDMTAPTVTTVTPVLAFDSTTQLPTVLPVSFALAAAFPMAWQLRLINPVVGASLDLTDGLTPGAVPVPAGGGWSTPALAITLTMSALFMTALGKTTTSPHEIYLTGISRRGRSAYAVARLTVT